MRRSRAAPAGFTLLELLIGLALLSLLLLLLFSSLRLGQRVWDTGEKALGESNAQVLVSGFLRRALTQIQPWRFNTDAGQVLAFTGEADTLRFAGILPSQAGRAGLRVMALESVEGRVRLRHRPPIADTKSFDILDGAENIPLIEGVRSMSFEYYGAEQADGTATWKSSWHGEAALPKLIRVRLLGADGKPWPELVVAPMLDADANCDWDPVRKYCQDPNITASIVAGPQSSRKVR
jgi:general secretion pathway protein J